MRPFPTKWHVRGLTWRLSTWAGAKESRNQNRKTERPQVHPRHREMWSPPPTIILGIVAVLPELATQARGAQRTGPPRLAICASIGTAEVAKTPRGIRNAGASRFANESMRLSRRSLPNAEVARPPSYDVNHPLSGAASDSYLGGIKWRNMRKI